MKQMICTVNKLNKYRPYFTAAVRDRAFLEKRLSGILDFPLICVRKK